MDQDDKPTIDNMPDEVLVEIFSFFSPKLLKISALVCSRWDNLIGQTPELMKNFRLNLGTGLSDDPALTRRFQNLKIDSLGGAVPEILHKLNNIQTLEFGQSSIRRQELVDALEGMKQLNTLKAHQLQLVNEPDAINEPDAAIEPVKLSKLKHLSLQTCSEGILSLFSTTTLETIEITHQKWTAASAYENELVKRLLMDQPALHSLSLHHADINNILENDVIHEFPFSLQAFKTSPSVEISMKAMKAWSEAFTNFLKLHKDTLKMIVLKDIALDEWQEAYEEPQETQERASALDFALNALVLALNSLLNLESLEIPFNITLRQSKDLQPFATVKRYSTQRFTITPKNARAFVRLFPEVDTLQVEEFRDKVTDVRGAPFHAYAQSVGTFLTYISKHLPGLEELAIPNFCSDFSQNLNFEALNAIKVGWVRSSHAFKAFIERHADTLESLEIDIIDKETHSVNLLIDAIQSCTKLKRISLIKPNPISLFKNKISRNHPCTLETRISVCYFECRRSVIVLRVAYKFPDDEALFQDKCTTCDENLIRGFNFFDCCEVVDSKMDC